MKRSMSGVVVTFAAVVAASVAHAGSLQVDIGIRRIPACVLRSLAFRTPREALAVDACGKIYRSEDGGHGWVPDLEAERAFYGAAKPDRGVGRALGPTIRLIHWWSPTDGVAGFVDGVAFVTSDGGASWSRARTPDAAVPTAVSVAGDSLWACEADGRVIRADRRGRTWIEVASPFATGPRVEVARPGEAQPIPAADRCVALEMSRNGRGIAIAENGTAWSTNDGGASWTQAGAGERRRVNSAMHGTCTASFSDGVVRCEGDSLVFEGFGSSTRKSPLVTPRTGDLRAVIQTQRTRGGWIGYTREYLIASEDGATWFVDGELPAAPRSVTELPSGVVILEAEDGRVFRRWRGEWGVSPAPELDRADLALFRTGKSAPPPFLCVQEAEPGRVEVSWASADLTGSADRERVLVLEVARGHGVERFENIGAARERRVDAAATRAFVRRLAAAVEPLEREGRCRSTATREVTIAWRCAREGGSMSFERSVCDGGVVPPPRPEADGWSRALEVERVIWQEYEAAVTASPSDMCDRQVASDGACRSLEPEISRSECDAVIEGPYDWSTFVQNHPNWRRGTFVRDLIAGRKFYWVLVKRAVPPDVVVVGGGLSVFVESSSCSVVYFAQAL